MITREKIQILLEAGSRAPSGDNSQPWHFRVRDNVIVVFCVPNKDNPFLNFEQGGTLLGCGAVIENIVIRASREGIACDVVLFPDEENAVAQITLREESVPIDPLNPVIEARHTNRHAYSNSPLSDLFKGDLSAMTPYAGVTHVMHSSEHNKQALAYAGSRAEIAILENEELHSLLFNNVVWTREEERLKKEGLFVKTLELAPPQEFVFGLCRKWSFMQHLNKFGFPKFIAYDDAKKYATGGAYISLIADSVSRENFVNAGRLMERIWLIANQHDYAVHPITATLFFGLKIRANKVSGLTSQSWELMRSAYALIRKTLELGDNKEVLFMFRIGEAPRVRFRSSKKPPVVDFGDTVA